MKNLTVLILAVLCYVGAAVSNNEKKEDYLVREKRQGSWYDIYNEERQMYEDQQRKMEEERQAAMQQYQQQQRDEYDRRYQEQMDAGYGGVYGNSGVYGYGGVYRGRRDANNRKRL